MSGECSAINRASIPSTLLPRLKKCGTVGGQTAKARTTVKMCLVLLWFLVV